MANRQELEALFRKHGYNDFKWLDPQDIAVAQWVRFRCLYGCASFGKKAACPPHTPSIDECRKMIAEYREGVLFHFEKEVEKPQDRKAWGRQEFLKLLELEREIFLAGYYKVLLIPFESCNLCEECAGNRNDCKNPLKIRAGADALGIDVFATVRKAGYSIQVLRDYKEKMNRFAFILIE